MSGIYLEDHPPTRAQYRLPRRAPERGVIVMHTAENTPDLVAFDGGAEAVARFIQTRATAGSYHELGDSDSRIQLVRDTAEAFGDATGSNAWAWHYSIATRADVWPLTPPAWRDGAIEQAAQGCADYAHRLHHRTGLIIPPRRITRAESEAAVAGFISHGDRDPARRHDPGALFPWTLFLNRYAELTTDLNPPQPTPLAPTPEVIDMDNVTVFPDDSNRWWWLHLDGSPVGGQMVPVSAAAAANWAKAGAHQLVIVDTAHADALHAIYG